MHSPLFLTLIFSSIPTFSSSLLSHLILVAHSPLCRLFVRFLVFSLVLVLNQRPESAAATAALCLCRHRRRQRQGSSSSGQSASQIMFFGFSALFAASPLSSPTLYSSFFFLARVMVFYTNDLHEISPNSTGGVVRRSREGLGGR